MKFQSMNEAERQDLIKALRGNGQGGTVIKTDPFDTSFSGTDNEISDEEVISQIKSVPTHY